MDNIEKTVPKLNQKESNKPKNIIKRDIFLSRLKRKVLKQVWIVRFLILASALTLIFAGLFFLQKRIANTEIGYYLGIAKDFVFPNRQKVNQTDGRTNILILGKGGEGHEAPDLTDTIIMASVSYNDPKLVFISLPRDIWIPSLRAKLNSVYYWGNQKQEASGIALAKATVEEILNLPIHYGAVVDFSGLKKIVDDLGGIDVNVKNSFVDEKYPIAGLENDLCNGDPEYKCRFEKIEFFTGTQNMSGETVLKFVRSRNSVGDEGTDFARAARQQVVVEGIKNKVLSGEILFSPKKLVLLKKTVLDLVETDISPNVAAIIMRRVVDVRGEIEHYVLPENFLEKPPTSIKYDNLYVFIPKKTDANDPTKRSWVEIDNWVKCVLVKDSCGGVN